MEEGARDEDRVLVRALAHLDGGEPTETAAAAIRATAESTEAELRDLIEDQVMTERALAILRKASPTLTARLWPPCMRTPWPVGRRCLPRTDAEDRDDADYDDDDDEADDREPYKPEPQDLQRFLEDEVMPWYRRRRGELENRHLIRAQAFGEALDPDRLEKLARYEVHLDRKLERILGMLLKLQDLRRTITPDATA